MNPFTYNPHNAEALNKLFPDSYEYPSEQIREHGGVAPNTLYAYVSSTFLDGFINYVGIVKCYMVERYVDWDNPEDEDENIEAAIAKFKTMPHSNLSQLPDDVFILAKTEQDFWYFWYDRDCSDSCIGRISRVFLQEQGVTEEKVLELFEKQSSFDTEYYKNMSWENGKVSSGRKVELTLKGWISG